MDSSKPKPSKLQVYKLTGLLDKNSCDVLVSLGEKKGPGYITGFNGFDVEAILKKIETNVQNLTSLPIENQEPIYLEKIIGQTEYRVDSFSLKNPRYSQEMIRGGNRLFSVLFYLTDTCEIFFPNLRMNVKHEVGNGLIWNNLINDKQTEDVSYFNSGNGWIGVVWVRQKKFE